MKKVLLIVLSAILLVFIILLCYQKYDSLQRNLVNLRDTVSSVESENQDLKDRIDDLESRIDDLESRINDVESQVH